MKFQVYDSNNATLEDRLYAGFFFFIFLGFFGGIIIWAVIYSMIYSGQDPQILSILILVLLFGVSLIWIAISMLLCKTNLVFDRENKKVYKKHKFSGFIKFKSKEWEWDDILSFNTKIKRSSGNADTNWFLDKFIFKTTKYYWLEFKNKSKKVEIAMDLVTIEEPSNIVKLLNDFLKGNAVKAGRYKK